MARTGGLPQPTITDDRALGGTKIQRSLRCNYDDSCELRRTFGTNTSDTTKTFSFWMKRGTNTGSTENIFSTTISGYIEGRLRINTDDTLQFEDRDASGGTSDGRRTTTRVFRDTDSWYHIMLVLDSTQGTELDRAKIYVNGTQDTNFSATRDISQNYSFSIFRSSVVNYIGNMSGSSEFFDGYLAEVNFIDGQALDPSYFGFTDSQTGIWMPKRYEGTYGNNGFYLDFSDRTSQATLGIDKSPNGNDFTIENIDVNDSMLDTPSNNFPTLRLLQFPPSSGSTTITKGNLRFRTGSTGNGGGGKRTTISTMAAKSGKWYFEVIDDSEMMYGIGSNYALQSGDSVDRPRYILLDYASYAYYGNAESGSYSSPAYGARNGYTANSDISQIYVDMDAPGSPVIYFGRNGQWGNNTGSTDTSAWNSNEPINGMRVADLSSVTDLFTRGDGNMVFMQSSRGGASDAVSTVNFGQDSTFTGQKSRGTFTDANGIGEFQYQPPKDALALCAANLPMDEGAIIRPQKHFDTLLYTGTGSSNIVDGLEFSPDLVWVKGRDTNGYEHMFIDSVRGGTKSLVPNAQDSESTHGGRSMTFLDRGVRWNSDSGNCNANGENYVLWCWKAGGSSNTYNINDVGYASATAAGLDGGTIDPTGASINTKCGFSIITYTGNGTAGATIAHGLGIKPAWIIIKCRSNTDNWMVNHQKIDHNSPEDYYLEFNEGTSRVNSTIMLNDTAPTSTLVTLGSDNSVNGSSRTYVMYCWSEIPGYSKFGRHIGNDNTDGIQVHLGFRPAWLMIKNISSSSRDWDIVNAKVSTSNPVTKYINANLSNGEDTYTYCDFLANGFKARNGGNTFNSSDDYVYFAFAEQPGRTPFSTSANAR